MSAPRFDARRLAGRLVLVTGAGSGIGRATCFAFAEAGARVLAVDIDGDGAERTAHLAALLGPEAHALVADVSSEAAMENLARHVAEVHGTVDVLVNNAGIGAAGSFLDTPAETWRAVIDVNLWGVIHGCRLFGRQMAERGLGGHIVNVASAAAFQPSRTLPAYCTSKAAVLMLSECLRAELADHRIGVSAICPGLVATNITRTARIAGRDEAAAREAATAFYARRDFGPEGVAEAIRRAVRDNADVVAVTPEAQVLHGLARFAPYALRALSGIDWLAPSDRREA
jgi:NAD(P)-dependent dehydrogenase (short-subunit alcohol dehydrogenase family)